MAIEERVEAKERLNFVFTAIVMVLQPLDAIAAFGLSSGWINKNLRQQKKIALDPSESNALFELVEAGECRKTQKHLVFAFF